MFSTTRSGDDQVVAYIIICLDSGAEFDLLDDSSSKNDIHPPPLSKSRKMYSMMDVLLLFLSSLDIPVIPPESIIEGYASIIAARTCIDALPRIHRQTLLYVASFLKECAGDSYMAGVDIGALAKIFAPVLARGGTGKEYERKRISFLMRVLEIRDE